MKKGLGRELAQFVIFACIIVGVLAIIWIATQLDWLLAWVADNWLPFTIGFAVAMIMKLIASAFFNGSKKKYKHVEEVEE